MLLRNKTEMVITNEQLNDTAIIFLCKYLYNFVRTFNTEVLNNGI